jgi:REP element-mobilizing transposase RayT
LATVLRNEVDSPAIKINGVEDHVHILCQLSRKFPVMSDVKSAKTESTKWLKKKDIAGFAWQSGYGAFSVSGSNVEQVKQYIENQQVHHQSTSFADAFRAICKKHGMEIDERFVWD